MSKIDQSYIVNKVLKPLARRDSWCSTHSNCFRYSDHESKKHRDLKLREYIKARDSGMKVYCELQFSNGLRPDLVIVNKEGEIKIVEIVVSENKDSIEQKRKMYPFPIEVINE